MSVSLDILFYTLFLILLSFITRYCNTYPVGFALFETNTTLNNAKPNGAGSALNWKNYVDSNDAYRCERELQIRFSLT